MFAYPNFIIGSHMNCHTQQQDHHNVHASLHSDRKNEGLEAHWENDYGNLFEQGLSAVIKHKCLQRIVVDFWCKFGRQCVEEVQHIGKK